MRHFIYQDEKSHKFPGGKDIFLLSPDAGAKPGHQVK